MKFSGPRAANDEAIWAEFKDEFEQARRLIQEHEGPVPFSVSGTLLSFSGTVNIIVLLALAGTVAGIGSYAITRRFRVMPGRASVRYSIFIMVMCVAGVALQIWKAVAVGTLFSTYETALIFALVFALHLNALLRRSSASVLVAVSFVFGLFVAQGVYIAIGWLPIPTGNAIIGIVLGLGLLGYVLTETLIPVR